MQPVAMTAQRPELSQELARLFAELGEIYGRAREGVSAPATTKVTLKVREEAARASEVIRRIRELQGL